MRPFPLKLSLPMARPGPHVVDHSLGQSSTLAPHGEYDSWGARGAVNASPSGFMGTIIFLFFKSLSKVETCPQEKNCHLSCLLHQNQNRIYASQNCAFWRSGITSVGLKTADRTADHRRTNRRPPQDVENNNKCVVVC